MPLLLLFFTASGWSALVYQVVWQRVLFRVYGIDIESTTFVVTAFMLGLGLGSLFGGWLSRRLLKRAVLIFALVEAAIGTFGVFSVTIFEAAAEFTAGVSHLHAALICFFLLLIPTLLMGATLPILVAFATQKWKNVGRSVSHLYLSNTLGAALGALCTGHFLLERFGLHGSVFCASSVNLGAGLFVFLLFFLTPHEASSDPELVGGKAS